MKNKNLVTLAYFLASIAIGLFSAVEGPALPYLAQHTNSRIDQISLIFLFGGFGYLVGSMVFGRIFDHLPGHRILSFITILIALTATIIPILHSLLTLVIMSALLGFAKGGMDVGCTTLLIWTHDKKVGPYMNGLHAFFGVGAFLSPLVVAQVISLTNDIHWVYWSFAAISLPIAALIWSLPSPQKREAPSKHGNSPAFSFLPIFLIAFCFATYVGAEVGYGNWLYVYATTRGLGTNITSAYLTSAFWGSFTCARLLGVWISTRVRPKFMLFVDLIGCLLSSVMILVWPNSSTLLWVYSILLGAFMASVYPSLMNLAEERMHITGTIAGWFVLGAGAGGMLVPWFIGQVFTFFNGITLILTILGSLVINLLVLYLYTSQKTIVASR